MPITPFHFGPGALIKVIAPRHVSWTTFALANCLIDLEPITYFLITGDPAHRFFHTLLGATLAAVVAVWPGRRVCEWWLRVWNSRLNARQKRWLGTEATIPMLPAIVGAIAGAWSHILLDAAMHVDASPFWPLMKGNPWHGWIGMDRLHWLCVGSGMLGLAWWVWIRKRRPFIDASKVVNT